MEGGGWQSGVGPKVGGVRDAAVGEKEAAAKADAKLSAALSVTFDLRPLNQ